MTKPDKKRNAKARDIEWNLTPDIPGGVNLPAASIRGNGHSKGSKPAAERLVGLALTQRVGATLDQKIDLVRRQ
jgi:hypothetical protein